VASTAMAIHRTLFVVALIIPAINAFTGSALLGHHQQVIFSTIVPLCIHAFTTSRLR
jgi:hypothetical protein